ncbi:MAG: DUF1499 domain-containing protein [Chitinivibrionales bacterium]|nr:DUF1499 domain-containing protein [Chitinivibrionales bacterium]MBD3396480.1 DUF1499 domain-containing protein [Chitinivibrionales bacterium]
MKIAVIVFLALVLASCTGTRPSHIGDGALAPCPGTPNCVSTKAPADDSAHAIAPLVYSGSMEDAMATLKAAVDSMPRTELVAETKDYLYVEFTSAVWRFVDDVEFIFDDEKKVIHFRSASRLGKSDLGVNRARMEEVRALFEEASGGAASGNNTQNSEEPPEPGEAPADTSAR